MNEQDFVSYLARNFPFRYGRGIGDDASVVPQAPASLMLPGAVSALSPETPSPAVYQLITKDILVENVHFDLAYFTLEEIALRSLAVNLSDIAAMGGTAHYFYLGLGFPGRLGESRVFDFFEGLKKGCEKWNVQLAGGDYSAAPVLFISITMVGSAPIPVYRDAAREHDLIGITGVTGESALGLKLIRAGIGRDDGSARVYIEKHKVVQPELAKGILAAPYVNAMIDVSDGLIIDLSRVLAASGKGGRVYYEKLPISPGLQGLCARYGIDEYDTVLAGGEDFVLLFTISPQREKELAAVKECLPYYIIGEVTSPADGLQVLHRGQSLTVKRSGYDHFVAQ